MNPSASASASLAPILQPLIVNVPTPSNPTTLTDLAAWFGAIVSLLLVAFEIYKYWNDKGKLKITYRFNLEIIGRTLAGDFRKMAEGKTFWSIDIANIGTKNIIVTTLTIARTDTKKFYMITKDFGGDIPRFTLIPGDNHSYSISNEMIDPKKVKEILITDAVGKTYKKKVRLQ